MATIFKHEASNQTIRPGKAWNDNKGVQHPGNWHIWSTAEKTAAGITEIVLEDPPDSRLYKWSQNANGTISKTAKSLIDVNVVDGNGDPVLDDEGNQLVELGVRTNLKQEVSNQQRAILNQTDWYIIRKADKGTAIPANIQTWRDAIRTKGDAMKSAIDGAANTAAVAALFVTYDKDGNKSGILYDWPELAT
tara:strand:+ start:146 stop:721 length:576 start_codon:yes stop_codon:yes gene_type:complete